jgi:hypothetical protein
MKRIIYIFFIAIMAAACVKEQNKNEFGSDAIGFSPVADATKANVSIDNDAALQGTGFGVYAYYTGTNDFVSPNDVTTLGKMLLNDKVSYSSSAWTYTPAQYWPENGRKVSFFAYAPWTLWNGTVTPNATTGMPEIPYTASTDLDNQKDILWGVGEDGYPLKNMTKPTDMTAHFHFRHALCRLHFKIADFEDLTSINNDLGTNWTLSNGNKTQTRTQATTVVLIEYMTIANLYGTGVLSLNNTTTNSEWSNKTGNLTYTINANNNLSSSLIYYSASSTLLNKRTTLTGVNSTNTDILGGKFIYAIPRLANEKPTLADLTITIKYHIISFTYTEKQTRKYTDDPWSSSTFGNYKVNKNNDNGGAGFTVSATNTVAIQGNHDETFNIEINGKYLDLKVKANPWTVNEDELSYNSGTVTVSESNRIHWTDNSFDVLVGSNLYISTKTASCTFTISNPARYLWSATLIPVAGNASAFMFVDADGNEIENPNGAVGDLATLRIKARKETTTVQNKAILRIFVKTATGSEVAFATGYNGTTEYTIIQDAN